MSNLQKVNQSDGIWLKDGHDFILHLGTMRKAVVISGCSERSVFAASPDFYTISLRSYFPFYNDDYNKRFSTADEAKNYAIGKIREWLQSVFVATEPVENTSKSIES